MRRFRKILLTLMALAAAFGGGMYHKEILRVLDTIQSRSLQSDEAIVRRVVDGDTFVMVVDGREEKVRLIGIDTPESRANEKAGKDARHSGKDLQSIVAQGKQAKRFVEALVPAGTSVRIEIDVQERDKYGRMLAYLYLPDGRMVNEEIIKAGFASPMTYPPNVKYEARFRQAYQKARENKVGLWK